MQSRELLEAAADRVRDLAIHFESYSGGSGRFDNPVEDWLYWNTDRNGSEDARRWIAALSPAAAAPIEAILRRAASDYGVFVAAWESTPRADGAIERLVEQQFGGTLALARAILGSGVDTHG